jgi:ribosomal protein S12 methylthiotransferase
MVRGAHLFSLVNLGCPKNTVDSEGILGSLALAGFQFTEEPAEADLCLVNTCGFLDASRREAAGVLEELATQRKRGGRPLLVATGCLVERIGGAPELDGFLQAADARVGFADYPRLPEICMGLLEGQATAKPTGGYAGKELPKTYLDWLDRPRMRIGAEHSAYLKIGEGCSNNCAYCSIPLIRGQRASRPLAAILKEARELVASGAKELNLIAQDTTAYGVDLAGKPQLAELLKELLKMPGELWFRVMYAHPRHLTDEILATMAADARVCRYLDLPLQHVNDKMLEAMKRGYVRARVDEALAQVDHFLPGAALRTTFIVGHPGEGEAEFEELMAFVEEGHFDHMGAFVWSPEPGTASAALGARVEFAVAEERRDRLMAAQAQVSAGRLRARLGTKTTLLLERKDKAGWHGRTMGQAPEVDGETVLEDAGRTVRAGDFVNVKIVRTTRYDCWARRLEK